MEIDEKDLKVSETFNKVSKHLEDIKINNETKLKVSLSDTQEVNLLLNKYSQELKTKFKYNKYLCSTDDIKKFLLENFPNAKIGFFKLLKLGFIDFGKFFLILYFILAPIYLLIILNFTVYSLQISVLGSILLSLFTSTMITLPLYPSEIKSTRGQFKIE